MNQCNKLTRKGLKVLEHLPLLETFNIFMMLYQRQHLDIAFLTKVSLLTTVNLGLCNLRDSDLQNIAELKLLRFLNLENNPRISNDGLVYIANLTHMEELSLAALKISDNGLASIAGMTQMKKLNLSMNKGITGSSFVHLLNMKQLAVLDVTLCCLICKGEGLATLGKITQLKKLVLYYSQVDDENVKHLANMTNLTYLNLSYNREITDNCLAFLERMTLMKELYFNSCGNVSNEGLNRLAAKMTYLTKIQLSPCHPTFTGLF